MDERATSDLVERISTLVVEGAYRDDLPGKPEKASSGRGPFRRADGGQLRRMYQRCSAEYHEALTSGSLERLPPLRVASQSNVAEAEALIGFRLPPLLRRLYLEVGNGGFGPGYGVLGLHGGHTDDTRRTAVDLYRQAHVGPSAWWPFLKSSLLPICHWGCAIYSFVDCSVPSSDVWAFDPNAGPQGPEALFACHISLNEWLSKWVDCELFQPALVQDPDGSWRGATDEEIRRWLAEVETA